MNLLMIAVIQQNKKTVGYRIFDTDAKDKKFMDVPAGNMKDVLKSGKAEVCNLGIVDGELAGTNGSVERYAKIIPNGTLISNTSPLVIINQLGDAGYTVVDYQGKVKKARTSDVVAYANKFGIANGKIVMKDHVEFISSIAGTYPIEKIATSKVKGNNDDVKIHISLSNNNVAGASGVAKHANVDVQVEIEENDVFSAMSDTQKSVIKAYYIWYTVDKYKSLAKSVRLDLAVGKAEQLAELRGITEWEFGGIEDAGFLGAARCQLKHPVRYKYYAVPVDDRDNPDARIIFGETCSADFFHIKPEDMKNLVKTRTIMSDEIKLMADILTNNQERLYMGKAALLYAVIRKLSTTEKIVSVFGEKVGKTLISFVMTKLPFPMSLVLEASKVVGKNKFDFYLKVFPEYANTIREILGNNYSNSIIYGGNRYLEFIASNKIEGDYTYNPLDETIKRRDIGAYNKDTRYRRQRLLYTIEGTALCRDFTFEELDSLLYCSDTLLKFKAAIDNEFKDSKYMKEDPIGFVKRSKNFADEDGLDIGTRNERIAIHNALMISSEYNHYGSKFLYYTEDRTYALNHKYIKHLRTSLNNVENKFTGILTAFSKYYNDIEGEKEREAKEQIARIEKEMEEQAERDKKRQEAERIKKEQEEKANEEKRLAEEAKKNEELANDKTTQLKKLIEDNTSIDMTPGIEVAKSILESGKLYNELSPKQRWRIDDTIKIYENSIKGDKTEYNNSDSNKEEVNRSYSLDEYPEIKEKAERILSKKDDKIMKKIEKTVPFALKIALTVTRYNKASDKQLKHINKAIEILDQA